jgi:hypothetical protein
MNIQGIMMAKGKCMIQIVTLHNINVQKDVQVNIRLTNDSLIRINEQIFLRTEQYMQCSCFPRETSRHHLGKYSSNWLTYLHPSLTKRQITTFDENQIHLIKNLMKLISGLSIHLKCGPTELLQTLDSLELGVLQTISDDAQKNEIMSLIQTILSKRNESTSSW